MENEEPKTSVFLFLLSKYVHAFPLVGRYESIIDITSGKYDNGPSTNLHYKSVCVENEDGTRKTKLKLVVHWNALRTGLVYRC